jgi:hypothetical protein
MTHKYKIVEIETEPKVSVFKLYVKSETPFWCRFIVSMPAWEFAGNFPSKSAAVEQMRIIMKYPREVNSSYYYDTGVEDNMW